jgi:magnesium-transporting ATPase (P-type)
VLQKPPRDPDEQLITPWVFVRYMVVGAYVGCATVGVFVTWYLCDSFFGIDLSQVRWKICVKIYVVHKKRGVLIIHSFMCRRLAVDSCISIH